MEIKQHTFKFVHAVKSVILRGNYSIKCSYWKEQRSQISYLSFHLKKKKKEKQQIKPKTCKRKMVTKSRNQYK